MKKFKFNLENVLKQKELLEKMAQKRYFDLRKKILDEREKAEKTHHMINQTQKELLHVHLKGRMEANTVREYQFHLLHLGQSLAVINDTIRLMEKDLESIRQALVHAAQNKKIIVRLKDRAYAKFREELDTREERFVDELTTMRSKMSN